MWLWICIIGLISLIFIWGIVAGTRREDDYEDQMRAIDEWIKRHRNG